MKKTIDFYEFVKEFENHDRMQGWTREGLSALFDWLEEFEESTGEETELDVIGLCCEFTEYESLEAFNVDYGGYWWETIEELEEHTTVIEFDGGIIVGEF